MKGRSNGSPELERAADYIAEAFKAAGLRPAGDNGSWFQSFELDAGLIVGRDNRLTIERDGKRVTLTPGSAIPAAAPDQQRPTARLRRSRSCRSYLPGTVSRFRRRDTTTTRRLTSLARRS